MYDWIATAPADDEAFTAYFKDPHRLSVTLAVEHEGVVIGDLYRLFTIDGVVVV